MRLIRIAIRVMLAVFAAACADSPRGSERHALSVPPPPRADESEPEAEPEPQLEGAVLIGTLRRLGTKVCTSHETADWRDVHLRAGFVRLEGETSSLEALRDQPVILFGTVIERGAPKIPPNPGTCLPIQRRSDWIDGPDGLILKRDEGPGIAAFRVRSSRRFEQLRVRQSGDELLLELENPLDIELDGAALSVHYEGCYGKPLTHVERRELGKLSARAKKSARVPAVAIESRGSRDGLVHVPVSVQVHGKASEVYFDLDVRLAKLGVEIRCPER